jgi:hypothetical protein
MLSRNPTPDDAIAAALTLPCPRCGRVIPVGNAASSAECPPCGQRIALARRNEPSPTAPGTCTVCGSEHLYWRKDFHQKAGCALIAIGALLTPWTYGLSLAVLALVDLVLYRLLPRITVCYVCGAIWRGVPPHPSQRPFDLMTAQTCEARSINWAERRVPAAASTSADP